MRRTGRAWYISLREMLGKPGTERSFLAGETESVFEITNWSTRNVIHCGFGDVSLAAVNSKVSEGASAIWLQVRRSRIGAAYGYLVHSDNPQG